MMTTQEIEELYIRSLDTSLTSAEKDRLVVALNENNTLAVELSNHNKIRETLLRKEPVSFGHFFAAKLIARIENSGVIIERQIFSFFKKYQLVAAGIIVALLILNTVFSDQISVDTILGLDDSSNTTNTTTDEIVSFDFYKTLNNDL